jgi:hypothetical protein
MEAQSTVGFVADKLAPRHIFLCVLHFSRAGIISSVLHTHSYNYRRLFCSISDSQRPYKQTSEDKYGGHRQSSHLG